VVAARVTGNSRLACGVALAEILTKTALHYPALWGQWLFRWGRSEVRDAWQLCGRLLTLADKSGDRGLQLQAHHAAWATSFGRGELAETRAHAEAGLVLYDAKMHQAMASSYGNHDASACAQSFTALSLALRRTVRSLLQEASMTRFPWRSPSTTRQWSRNFWATRSWQLGTPRQLGSSQQSMTWHC
jgi:predicted ATPase